MEISNILTRRYFIKSGIFAVAGAAVFKYSPFDIAFADAQSKGLGAIPSERILVAYFSHPETNNPNNMTADEANSTVVINGRVLGNTQYFATVIQEQLGADIFRIEPSDHYPTNHAALLERAQGEQDRKARPALKSRIDNLDKYDLIFIGYPIWYYQLPMILHTFLEQHDFSSKTIIPFNTHGGSRFSGTVEVIAKMQPNATVRTDGLTISRDRIQDSRGDIIKWLNGLDVRRK